MLESRSKKIALAMLGAAAITTLLTAADFWVKKPYTDWTDDESHKLVTSSPWAWQKGIDSDQNASTGQAPTQHVTALWQSALPVKRAMYGKTSLTNPQQKAILDRQETIYLLRLTGIPSAYRVKTDGEKLKMITELRIKGRDPIHPIDVQIPEVSAPKGFGPPGAGKGKGAPNLKNFQNNFQRGGGGGGSRGGGGGAPGDIPVPGGGFGGGAGFAPAFDVFFAFPKSLDLKLEDVEMEFETNIGGLVLKHKYKLKDMVYEGKLEI